MREVWSEQEQDPRQLGEGHLNRSGGCTERVDRQNQGRRKKGGGNATINATFDVDNRIDFSPIKTVPEYIQDVGRCPRTHALRIGDGEKYRYFVDSSGRILNE